VILKGFTFFLILYRLIPQIHRLVLFKIVNRYNVAAFLHASLATSLL
jgi:hypothetical protein